MRAHGYIGLLLLRAARPCVKPHHLARNRMGNWIRSHKPARVGSPSGRAHIHTCDLVVHACSSDPHRHTQPHVCRIAACNAWVPGVAIWLSCMHTRLVVPVLRSCQSPIWIWLVNYLHLHLHLHQQLGPRASGVPDMPASITVHSICTRVSIYTAALRSETSTGSHE